MRDSVNCFKWFLSFELFDNDWRLYAVRKVLEILEFQALGSFESKTVWETVLAWAQKLKSEGAQ